MNTRYIAGVVRKCAQSLSFICILPLYIGMESHLQVPPKKESDKSLQIPDSRSSTPASRIHHCLTNTTKLNPNIPFTPPTPHVRINEASPKKGKKIKKSFGDKKNIRIGGGKIWSALASDVFSHVFFQLPSGSLGNFFCSKKKRRTV